MLTVVQVSEKAKLTFYVHSEVNIFATGARFVILTPFEENVVEHILRSSGASKHAARSALRHLERAWELIGNMPELAIFLGITAEEESATAVFHCLKRRKYKGAERINIYDHRHKTALHPLLLAIGQMMREFMEHNKPKLEFNSEL